MRCWLISGGRELSSSPEASLHLINSKNPDLWPGPTRRLPITLRMHSVQSGKSDWLRIPNEFSAHPQKIRSGQSFHSGQTTGQARDLRTSGDFRSLSSFITQNFQGQPPTLEPYRASVLSPIILPPQTFFSRVLLLRQQAFFIRKSFPREADDNNYSDKNTSLYVSLRTRKFDEKIQYCCRGSFFVEEDI